MPKFLVVWKIDIFEVDNPREAAEQARAIQLRPGSTATVFEVSDLNGDPEDCVIIDLEVPEP